VEARGGARSWRRVERLRRDMGFMVISFCLTKSVAVFDRNPNGYSGPGGSQRGSRGGPWGPLSLSLGPWSPLSLSLYIYIHIYIREAYIYILERGPWRPVGAVRHRGGRALVAPLLPVEGVTSRRQAEACPQAWTAGKSGT
jgi:hypothetical protein